MSETHKKSRSSSLNSPSRRLRSRGRKGDADAEFEKSSTLIQPNSHKNVYEQLERQLGNVLVPQIDATEDATQYYEEVEEKILKAIEDEEQRVNFKLQQDCENLTLNEAVSQGKRFRTSTQLEIENRKTSQVYFGA